jgi:crossover junction endodeoxyribonuclease RuvC
MRVLGIDPGYGRCGVAIVEKTATKDTVRYSACVETPATADFSVRLRMVIDHIERTMREHAPEALAIEKLYFSANQKTAMRVAEVRGAILSSAAAHGLPVFEYTPGEVKSAAAGSGRADKKQIASMLHLLVHIPHVIKLDDEYDAIAIGVTHLARARTIVPALHPRS